MSESYDEILSADGCGVLPRFLSSVEPARDINVSTPDGDAAWTAGRAVATGVAGVAALMSSAVLTPQAYVRRASLAAVPAVETVRVTPHPIMQKIENMEGRLAFGERFGVHLATTARLQNVESRAVAPSAAQSPLDDAESTLPTAQETETASLLIIRNLPESAMLSEGVDAGIGTWAIGGQDPQAIVATVEGGIDGAITAQVDVIAPSGATLETRAVTLPAKPKVASMSEMWSWQAASTVTAKADPGTRGPKRRAGNFKREGAVKVAQEPSQIPKRRKQRTDDAYRAPAPKTSMVETGVAGVQGEPGQEGGALSKFFSLFSGSLSNSPASTASKAPAREYDGSLRGLGMSSPN